MVSRGQTRSLALYSKSEDQEDLEAYGVWGKVVECGEVLKEEWEMLRDVMGTTARVQAGVNAGI